VIFIWIHQARKRSRSCSRKMSDKICKSDLFTKQCLILLKSVLQKNYSIIFSYQVNFNHMILIHFKIAGTFFLAK